MLLEPFNVAKMVGLHAGKPAWIIGGGPSLLRQNPKELRGGVVFAVNQHIEACYELGFPEPDYWFFMDVEFPLWHRHMFLAPPGRYPNPVKLCEAQPGAFLMALGFQNGGDGRGGNFLTVAFGTALRPPKQSCVVHAKGSTISGCLSLAFLMGCNPIHVRGVDFKNDDQGRQHWSDLPGTDVPGKQLYGQQRDYLHSIIQHFIKSGIEIDVQTASELVTTPYVPEWQRPAPLGELVAIGERK